MTRSAKPRPGRILTAAMLIASAGFALTLMSALVRLTAADVAPLTLLVLRSGIAVLLLLPLVARHERLIGTGQALPLTLLRSGLSFVSILAWFYGVALMPIALATVINFTMPLFAVALAALVDRERPTARQGLGMGLGFLGVGLALDPETGDVQYAWVVLLSAAAAAAGIVTTRAITRTEPARLAVFHLNMGLAALAIGPALSLGGWPAASHGGAIVLIAALALLAQWASARAYALAAPAVLAPFEFVRLIAALAIGNLMFEEAVTIQTLVGAALIVGGVAAGHLGPAGPVRSDR